MKAYLVTGAYNPPTLGHEEATRLATQNAVKSGHTHFFQGFGGSSETEDAPLSHTQKEGYIKDIHKHIAKDKSTSGIKMGIIPAEHSDPFRHVTHIIEKHGINDITIGLGSDQMAEKGSVKSQIESHIKKHGGFLGSDKKTIHPVSIRFEQLGEPRVEQDLGRDEELRRVRAGDFSVVKAGKIRRAHIAGDEEYVREMLPRGVNHSRMMKDLTAQNKKIAATEAARKAEIVARREAKKAATVARNAAKKKGKKKLSEEFLTEAVASIATRMKESRAAKRTAKRRALTRRIRSRSRRNIGVLKRRAYSQIKTQLRKRLFGGSSRKLSVAQRYMIDKMISKRKPILQRMVKAIIPKVVSGETKRVQRANRPRLNESSPLSFIINNLQEAAKYKTRQEVRRDQNDRKRKQRANDDAALQSNPFSGQILVVRDNMNDDLMIVKKDSFDMNRHTVVTPPEKMNMGAAQRTLKDVDFVNTPTSIELFGAVESAPTVKEKGGKKKQQQAQQQQQPIEPVEVPDPVKKTTQKSSFPDSDHDATDMEAGIVGAFNELKGLDIKSQQKSGLMGEVQSTKYMKSQTLSPAGQRAVIQLHKQLKKLFPDSDFVAMHYGSTKDQEVSGFWKSQGGRDNTPKSDILLQDRRTGVTIGVSVKSGPSQFMSGKAAGEATATAMTALQTMDQTKLKPQLRKKINELLDRFKNLVVSDRTSVGGIEQYKIGGEKEGEDKKVLKYDKLHHEAKKMLREIFSESREFKRALLLEAATGRVKFDTGKKNQTSPAVAQYLISVNKDGTDLSFNEINEEFIDKIADSVSQIEVRFKSNRIYSKKVGKKDTDPFNYWSVMALGTGSKGIHENLFSFNEVLNELASKTPEELTSQFEISQLIEQIKDMIDGDPIKFMEFLQIIPDEISMSTVDLTDVTHSPSGRYNTIMVNGKEIDIPVQQDMDYNDMSEIESMQSDAEETNAMMQQQQQKENHINIALTFLAERTKYNKATGRDYKAEYKWQGTKEQKKRRAKRNKIRRKLLRSGRVKKHDGKDIDHKNGNPHDNSSSNIRVVSKEYNRSKK